MHARLLKNVTFVQSHKDNLGTARYHPIVLEITKRNKIYFYFPHGFPGGMRLREKADQEIVTAGTEKMLPLPPQNLQNHFDFYLSAKASGNTKELVRRVEHIESICAKEYEREFTRHRTTV